MEVQPAQDVHAHLTHICSTLSFSHIDPSRIICMRSTGSKACAFARVWNLPRIWQKALSLRAHYVIEVLSERYDKLGEEEKAKVLIHELLHIPKNFSGALFPHRNPRKRNELIRALHAEYKKKSAATHFPKAYE